MSNKGRLFAALAFLAAFGVVAALVCFGKTAGVDVAASEFFSSVGGFAGFFTVTSTVGGAVPIVVLCVVLLVFWRGKGVLVAATMALSAVLNFALKNVFCRPRPEFGLVAESGFSFPSGHAQNNFALWLAVALLLPKRYFALVFFPLTVAIGRVYLNVHYVSDVLAGACLGVSVACFVNFFLEEKYGRKSN